MSWLLRDGEVLAGLEIAGSLMDRTRGLIGRETIDGAMLIRTHSIHTFGMRFAIDVAFCDKAMVVVGTTTLAPNRIGLPRRHGRCVIEARAGAFERWNLRTGDQLEIKG